MKKISFLLLGLIIALSGISQNYFESMIPPTDGFKREAKLVVETHDHGYIVSCDAQYIYHNDMLVSISPEGNVVNTLVFQIDGKNVKYSGLFRHPEFDDDYLAVATLITGDSYADYQQRELAFIRFDKELNILNQNVIDLGADYVRLSTSIKDLPKVIMKDDSTIFMAAHSLKTDGYCYLFAILTTGGELLKTKEDFSLNTSSHSLYDTFIKSKSDNSFGLIIFINGNGDGYYHVDSTLNCRMAGMLNNMPIRIVQEDPQQTHPDTTYYYAYINGTSEYLNDTAFLTTTGGRFTEHYGGVIGNCHFVTVLNDSLDVSNTNVWDIYRDLQNYKTRTLPANTKAISVTDNAVFHCGVMGLRDHSHYSGGSTAPTTVTVSKFDKELNLIWRRHYGNNGDFYDINTIQATEDGGCILTGIYAKGPGYQEYYSYILKVDENGYNSVSENEESIAKPYLCYPNPAKDIIYIEFSPDVNCKSVEIYDMDGRLVETCHGASLQSSTISIANLTSGLYLIKVRMSDGKEYSEKIVVK